MFSSTRMLPASYALTSEIDLSKNIRLAIVLNILATMLFFISLWFLYVYVNWVRPEFKNNIFSFEITSSTLFQIVMVFLVIAINLILHEAIHGLFFVWFTHSRPVFALKLAYAYAAAPEWYIPRKAYAVIGLAPLLIIDLVALLLIGFVPTQMVFPLLLVVTFNTSGAVGDLWIMWHLLRASHLCLVNDSGDCIRFYAPLETVPQSDQA